MCIIVAQTVEEPNFIMFFVGNNHFFKTQQHFFLMTAHLACILVLMKIDDLNACSFYEIEAEREQWSLRELRRQAGEAYLGICNSANRCYIKTKAFTTSFL